VLHCHNKNGGTGTKLTDGTYFRLFFEKPKNAVFADALALRCGFLARFYRHVFAYLR
jgi:hypothetical protein